MRRDLARLNHVLIPATKSERDRYRNSRVGRRARPLIWLIGRLTREGRIVLGSVGLAAAFALDVGRTESHMLVFATASLLLASLLFAPAYRLDGVSVDVRCPRRVTVGEELTLTLSFRNDGTGEHRCIRVERPLLPWDGEWHGPQPTLAMLPPGGTATHGRSRPLRRARRAPHRRDARHGAPSAVARAGATGAHARRALRGRPEGGPRDVARPRQEPPPPARRRGAALRGPARRAICSASVRTGRAIRFATCMRGRGRATALRWCASTRKSTCRAWASSSTPTRRRTTTGSRARCRWRRGSWRVSGCGDARVDLLVAGPIAQGLSSERNFGSLDQALDVLAAVQAEAFSAERAMARLDETPRDTVGRRPGAARLGRGAGRARLGDQGARHGVHGPRRGRSHGARTLRNDRGTRRHQPRRGAGAREMASLLTLLPLLVARGRAWPGGRRLASGRRDRLARDASRDHRAPVRRRPGAKAAHRRSGRRRRIRPGEPPLRPSQGLARRGLDPHRGRGAAGRCRPLSPRGDRRGAWSPRRSRSSACSRQARRRSTGTPGSLPSSS